MNQTKGDFLMKERKEYIDKMAEQLKAWDTEIAKYQEKANHMGDDVRSQYQERIARLKERRENVQIRLNELRQSGDEAWQVLKNGFEKSWSELKEAFDNARSKL